jgi:hypothetical protein
MKTLEELLSGINSMAIQCSNGKAMSIIQKAFDNGEINKDVFDKAILSVKKPESKKKEIKPKGKGKKK